jgi:hypothetical protein
LIEHRNPLLNIPARFLFTGVMCSAGAAGLPGYSQDRKTAIQSAMEDLLKAYMDCIEEVNKTD